MNRRVFIDNAHKYGTLGWPIFPLAEGEKVPMKGTDGFKSASVDQAQIAAWCRFHPHSNIGIATGRTSNIIVIDMDPRAGSNATLAQLAKEGKTFGDTVEAVSPRDGRHLYYAFDPRVTTSKANALGPGLDIKTDGGYVVAPPSFWRGIGKGYKWLRPPRGISLPCLPRWVIAALAPKPKPKREALRLPSLTAARGYRAQALADLSELQAVMAGLADGRHSAPFAMACRIGKYVAAGFLTHSEIEEAFLYASASNGALAKYSAKDLMLQIKNGLRRAVNDALPPLARIHRDC